MVHGEEGVFGLLLVIVLDTTARLDLVCRCWRELPHGAFQGSGWEGRRANCLPDRLLHL